MTTKAGFWTADEREEECDVCGEAFSGERAIRGYLRDVEVGVELERWCVGCLARPRLQGAQEGDELVSNRDDEPTQLSKHVVVTDPDGKPTMVISLGGHSLESTIEQRFEGLVADLKHVIEPARPLRPYSQVRAEILEVLERAGVK